MNNQWDHTRSPWWNLRRVYGLRGREVSSAAIALLLLSTNIAVAGVRTSATPVPVIASLPGETTPTPGPGGAPSSPAATDGPTAPSDGETTAAPQPGSSPTPGGTPGSPGPNPSTSPTTPGTRPSPTTSPTTPTDPAKPEVVVGFIRQTGTGENAGFRTPNQGDPNAQVETLVNWLNANGGLNGHPVKASIRTVDINNTSRPQEEATCRAFTEQDKAFAVVPLALIYAETRQCYADHGTILIDPTPFHMPEKILDELTPYIWQTSYPSTTRMIRALSEGLSKTDFFADDMVLGFVAPDTPYFRDSAETDAMPAFARYGVEFAEVAYIANDSIPSAQTSTQNAAFRFQTQGVTHVVFYGNALLAPLFMTNAEANAYFPRYGLTTFDQPKFMAEQWSTPASLADSVGVSFGPAMDVPDAQAPFPGPREQTCIDIYAADGHSWGSRNDAKNAIGYCDATFLLHAAAEKLGRKALTAQNLHEAVISLGTTYQAGISHRSAIVRGRQDISAAYRPMAYDGPCDCYRFTGPAVTMP